jgi:hypothetical protein
MNKLEEIRNELEKLLGYECVIVKLTTYNYDVGMFRKQKAEIEKYRNALEEITEATSMDEMREIAEDAISE